MDSFSLFNCADSCAENMFLQVLQCKFPSYFTTKESSYFANISFENVTSRKLTPSIVLCNYQGLSFISVQVLTTLIGCFFFLATIRLTRLKL